MSVFLAALVLFASTGDTMTPHAVNPDRRVAEIAILSAEEEVARLERKSPLIERLIRSARVAFDEGRYEDATGLARRARLSAGQRGREAPRVTRPVGPTIETLFEALERLQAAENRRVSSPLLVTARELVAAAEAAMLQGQLTQAEVLSRRAILMLAALPASRSDETAETGQVRHDINRAEAAELRRIPGMTEPMIRNLIWFRTMIGPLRTVEEIRYVPEFTLDYVPIAEYYLEVRPSGGNR
jgi:DNA uptake protein ComE-like DNA-binding protein